MRVLFPVGIDGLGLMLTKEEHNLTTKDRRVTPSDVAQVLKAALEKIGVEGSNVETSLDYRLARVEAALGLTEVVAVESASAGMAQEALNAVGALQLAVAALPTTTTGAGLPSTAGRAEGSWHYDTTEKFWNQLTEGVWVQKAS